MAAAGLQGLNADQLGVLGTRTKTELLRRKCRESFLAFLPYWKFTDRETGEERTFATLWFGQQEFADLMAVHPYIYALKAGKLGFTELECAWDGWVVMFGPRNARVHLFSRSDDASKELIGYISYGMRHLPPAIRPVFLKDDAGGQSAHSLKFKYSADDTRTIVAYAAGANVSVDLTCQHAHVDELARMAFAKKTWEAVYSTISPEGSCHVVTRGAGEDVFAATLWKAAISGASQLHPFFQPYTARPGRDRAWFEEQAGSMTQQGLKHFAPETPEDALAGDETNPFIAIELWDRCKDIDLPELTAAEPLVVGVDAGVSNDCFAIVGVTRNPAKPEDVAQRVSRLWEPPIGKHIDFDEPENFLKTLIRGGCVKGHPVAGPTGNDSGLLPDECDACAAGQMVPRQNVVQIVYDPYQLESMMQKFRKEGEVWVEPFSQGKDRLIADSSLRNVILNMRIRHVGNADMRQHMENAAAKLDPQETDRLRIVKKAPDKKVDLTVALSMSAYRCLYLLL